MLASFVYNKPGVSFRESIYENTLLVESYKRLLKFN